MCKFLTIFMVLISLTANVGYTIPAYNPPLDIDEENYPIDRREFIRFRNKDMKIKLFAFNSLGQNIKLIDFSRGGIAFANNSNFSKGETYNIDLKYQNITFPVETFVIAVEKDKVRTKFINLDIPKQNKLLYLSSKIEYDNNWLKTKLSGEEGKDFFQWGS